jgi:hypothetical protein
VDTKKKGSCGFMMEQIKGHEAINWRYCFSAKVK